MGLLQLSPLKESVIIIGRPGAARYKPPSYNRVRKLDSKDTLEMHAGYACWICKRRSLVSVIFHLEDCEQGFGGSEVGCGWR